MVSDPIHQLLFFLLLRSVLETLNCYVIFPVLEDFEFLQFFHVLGNIFPVSGDLKFLRFFPCTGVFDFLHYIPCTGVFEFLRYYFSCTGDLDFFPVVETLSFYVIFPVAEDFQFF